MKDIVRLGAAFIGLMVGGGFASGQEVVQFFDAFGLYGLVGTAVSGAFFMLLVMELYTIGSQLRITTHQQAMTQLFGARASWAADILLSFFLLCMITVMIAGSGASIHQQFGPPAWVGSAIMAVLACLTMGLDVRRIVNLIGIMTPLVFLMVLIMLGYSLHQPIAPVAALEQAAQQQPHAAGHWLVAAVLYVSYNIAGAAAVLLVLGGQVPDLRLARLGGLAGGGAFGLLLAGLAFVLFVQVDAIRGAAVPTLLLAGRISPVFGAVLLPVILVKLYCSSVGMTYALSSRLEEYGLSRLKGAALVTGCAWGMSQLGFVMLVKAVYPMIGYCGLLIMAATLFSFLRRRRTAPAPRPDVNQT
ncbi:MAG: hypothetical protein ABF791_08205 [Acetobacter sp.]|uniref:YkvI family membrane protein n=1 Tax=Acetobacter sp. TaxID=440 RepID=UPI0039E8EEB8